MQWHYCKIYYQYTIMGKWLYFHHLKFKINHHTKKEQVMDRFYMNFLFSPCSITYLKPYRGKSLYSQSQDMCIYKIYASIQQIISTLWYTYNPEDILLLVATAWSSLCRNGRNRKGEKKKFSVSCQPIPAITNHNGESCFQLFW